MNDNVTLWQGDCLEEMKRIEDQSIDAIITDPPYGIGFKYNDHDDNSDDYLLLVEWLVGECNRVLKPGCFAFVYVAHLRLRDIIGLFPENCRLFAACKNFTQFLPTEIQYGFDPVIFWKSGDAKLFDPVAGIRDWHIGNTAYYVTTKTKHPCPRPLDTIMYLVSNFCVEGGLVLDPFLGSGTTALAAIKTGRKCIGIEKDEKYFSYAQSRVNDALRQPFLPMTEQPKQLELIAK